MILHGREINILVDGVIVAVSTSCDITLNNETIEVASTSSGKYKTFRSGRNDWSISIGRFIQTVEGDINLIGKEVTVKIAQVDNSDGSTTNKVQGTAIVRKCSSSFQLGQLATGSLDLLGSGALSIVQNVV